jgi:hypothetical protein
MRNNRWILLVLVFIALAVGVDARSSQANRPTYDEFIRLSAEERDLLYAKLTVAQKGELLRAQFQHWLEDNRKTLNSKQIAAVTDAIILATPDGLRLSQDPKGVDRQLAVSSNLYCSLGPELAYAFAKGEPPPKPVERTWTQAVHAWIDWVANCVVK